MLYIENCLNSLREQTVQGFLVIVVDNGSTDGSKELVKEQFPEVLLIENTENRGFCKAVNQGICKAVSTYVILLNNDTVADSHFVEAMTEAIEDSPNIFSVSAKMISMKEPDKIDDAGNLYCALGWAYAIGKDKAAAQYGKKRKIFSACAGAAIYRIKLLQQIGLFDENHFAYLEDVDIGYRAQIYGYDNYFTPHAIVKHAGSGVSGSRYNEFKITLSSKNSVYLVYKNMPFLQILLNVPFLLLGYFIKFIFFAKKGYGKVYGNGLWKGILLCTSQEGKKQKVKFHFSKSRQYVKIQLALWVNIIRRYQ